MCLICNQSVAVNKEFNIKRHYETKHSQFSKYRGQTRKDKINHLKLCSEKQCSIFQKQNTESEKNTQASYEVSKLIAKNMKPFTDGDFVKDCLMAVVEVICPEKKNYSPMLVFLQEKKLFSNVKTCQQDCLKNLEYFSIAIDKSTDTKDTAQLAAFVRGVSSNFDIFEDFVELVPMKSTQQAQIF